MSKLTWDTLTLMRIASIRGKYYLHLEDDTPPIDGWFEKMMTYVSKMSSTDWFMIFFTGRQSKLSETMGGMFGKMFQTKFLDDMVKSIQPIFDTLPVDWHVGHYAVKMKYGDRVFAYDKIIEHTGVKEASTKVGVDERYTTSPFDELVTWEQCKQ